MSLQLTPTACGCIRGCVYSTTTRRPSFCGGCREEQYAEKKRRQRAAYRAANPVQRETKYSLADPEAVRSEDLLARGRTVEERQAAKKIRAAKMIKEKREKVVRVKKIEAQAAAVGPRARKQRGPKPASTHTSILGLWSRAHENSPLKRKYPTKDALRQAGLQPSHRKETVNT